MILFLSTCNRGAEKLGPITPAVDPTSTSTSSKGIPKLPSFGVTVVDAFEVRTYESTFVFASRDFQIMTYNVIHLATLASDLITSLHIASYHDLSCKYKYLISSRFVYYYDSTLILSNSIIIHHISCHHIISRHTTSSNPTS